LFMRTTIACLSILVLVGATAAAEQLTSPYRQDVQAGLRGLNANEIAELRAGAGMGLARAAELNSYPGPRHVLDAVQAGQLQASPDQVTRIRRIFDEMRDAARRIGAEILSEEHRLEGAFQAAAITEPALLARVERIAALQGQLRAVHLRAHVATRAILSSDQVTRYNKLRGYTAGTPTHHGTPTH
jgi:hypothetical protein